MKKLLFICGQNHLRSPTTEQIFSQYPALEAESAGTNNDADNPLSSELTEWADDIFVMEKVHRNKVQRRFKRYLNGKRLICLDIPDDYDYMDPELIHILKAKVARHLPAGLRFLMGRSAFAPYLHSALLNRMLLNRSPAN